MPRRSVSIAGDAPFRVPPVFCLTAYIPSFEPWASAMSFEPGYRQRHFPKAHRSFPGRSGIRCLPVPEKVRAANRPSSAMETNIAAPSPVELWWVRASNMPPGEPGVIFPAPTENQLPRPPPAPATSRIVAQHPAPRPTQLHPAPATSSPGHNPHCRAMSRPGPVHSPWQVEISAATWENIFREACKMGFPVAALLFHLEGLEYLGEASTGGECLQVVSGKCRLEIVRPVCQVLAVADGRGRFRRLVRVRRYRLRVDRRDLVFVRQVEQWSPVVGHPDAERGVQRNAATLQFPPRILAAGTRRRPAGRDEEHIRSLVERQFLRKFAHQHGKFPPVVGRDDAENFPFAARKVGGAMFHRDRLVVRCLRHPLGDMSGIAVAEK